MQLIILIVQ